MMKGKDEHNNPLGTVYLLNFPGSIRTYEFVSITSYDKLKKELASVNKQLGSVMHALDRALEKMPGE